MEHSDVLIIGAGISGIGALCHLKRKCPDKKIVVLENRANIGGTWDLFKYPGIRSDSDMYTFGYNFRPWKDPKDIAAAPAILKYLNETLDDYNGHEQIRFQHKVTCMRWVSAENHWIVDVTDGSGNSSFQMSCTMLVAATGYYRYEKGYLPDFKGYDDFKGTIAHPQHWPEGLDYQDKNILVIGSGATAVTLVPTMAETARHVTMLQRSPSYVFSRPAEDKIANHLKKFLPKRLAHQLARFKNVLLSLFMFNISKKRPKQVREWLTGMVEKELGPDFDVKKHFTPSYNPWDQRLCVVPDNDLFKALKNGSASVVTDHIETFTEKGVLLKSGETLNADIIIPATGLHLQFLGGIDIYKDDQKIDIANHTVYKGMMFSGIPNCIGVFGYTNASWTLKADLTSQYLCRMIKRMDKKGYKAVIPGEPEAVDQEAIIGLKSGYVERAAAIMPKQGTKTPWRNRDNYLQDYFAIKWTRLEDGVLTFSR